MSSKNRTIWNVTVNTTGTVVSMLSGLVVMPYLIQRLGSSTYGLWILIGTLTGYFGVLDLGASMALGRLIAAHRARGEHDQINIVMSTAGALLLGVFVIVCLATCAALFVFPKLFIVPLEQAADVRYSLILVGLNLALTFPSSIFAGFLWGHERFDLQNAVEVPTLIMRAVLSLTMVSAAMPLLSLGAITLGLSLANNAAKMVLCYRLDPSLMISWRHVRRARIRDIYSIGGWMSIISWSRTLIPQIGPTLIGMKLGNASVTTFTVARQLVAYTNQFSIAATQVMAPRAVAVHATQAVDAQRRLFIEGGKFAYALTLFFCGGLLCLGLPFIHWWQHGTQDAAFEPLMILTLGESLPLSQWLTYSVLIGANRQRNLSFLAIAEGLISLPLIVALVSKSGIIGVSLVTAVAAFLTRGLMQWLYGCWLLKIRPSAYVKRVFAPVTIAAALPIGALRLATVAAAPTTFRAIFLLAAAYALLFGAVVGCALLGYSRLKAFVLTPAR
jgi:O-antigen/teichoic acid export membrane protein